VQEQARSRHFLPLFSTVAPRTGPSPNENLPSEMSPSIEALLTYLSSFRQHAGLVGAVVTESAFVPLGFAVNVSDHLYWSSSRTLSCAGTDDFSPREARMHIHAVRPVSARLFSFNRVLQRTSPFSRWPTRSSFPCAGPSRPEILKFFFGLPSTCQRRLFVFTPQFC